MVVIAILGILIAIAIIIWLGILEQRRVDAAINQFAADLRLAHSNATNQLTDWRVIYTEGSPDYRLVRLQTVCDDGGCATPPPVARTITRSLPEGTKVHEDSTNNTGIIELNSDGTGRAFYGPSATVVVSSVDNDPKRRLTFAAATSRVEIAP
jgi:type II secretory pathway pseudopilin PulG